MRPEDFEHVLVAGEEIVVSSGFTRAVMKAVRREASGLRPILFPWQRVWPGLMVLGLAVVAMIFVPLPPRSAGSLMPATNQVTAVLAPFFETMRGTELNWILAALLLSWICVKFSIRLASWGS